MTRLHLAIGFGVLLVAGVALGVLGGHPLVAWGAEAVAALRRLGPWGWVGFFGLQALVALIGFLPASALAVAAGAVYGVEAGFPACALGVLTGALLAFVLARSAFRPLVERALDRGGRLARLDGLVGAQGWKLVCLLRISPLMPFSLTSYAIGLSSIPLADYMLGTLASLPALLLYVWLGALGAEASVTSSVRVGLLIFGLLATLALTIRLGQIASRALSRRVPDMGPTLGPNEI